MSLLRLALLNLLALACIGPARAAATAACGSDDSRQTLFNLIARELAGTVARDPADLRKRFDGLDLRLLHVVTTDHDDTAQHNRCSGSVSFTIPTELFQLSHAVASGATISLTGTILNDWLANGALMNGQLNTTDPHIMRALMIRIGQLPEATMELPITYKSDMTDDGTEHVVTLQGDISPLQAPVLAMMFWQDNPGLARSVKNDVAMEARAPQSPRFGGIDPNWGQRPPVSKLSSDPQTQKADYLAARAALFAMQAQIAAAAIPPADKAIADFRAANPDIEPVAQAAVSAAMTAMETTHSDEERARLQKSLRLGGLMAMRARLDDPQFSQFAGRMVMRQGMKSLEDGKSGCLDDKPAPCYDVMDGFVMWYQMASGADRPAYIAASEAYIDQRRNLGEARVTALEKMLTASR
jgi:hypothetical protein